VFEILRIAILGPVFVESTRRAEVHVHVDQTGQNGFAGGIDRFGVE
jgi:hypothetical protein